MQHNTKFRFGLMLTMVLGLLAGCGNNSSSTLTYTVTFDTVGGVPVPPVQEVVNGGKVTKPADPAKIDYAFTGEWKYGTFTWDFLKDIVTTDMTLVAQYLEITSTPSNIRMKEEPFSSTIQWMQTDADLQTFDVSIKEESAETFTAISGDITVDTSQTMQLVTFVPDTIPNGGRYYVKIEAGSEEATSELLVFGGAGLVANPYYVSTINDVITMLETPALSDKHFKQANDIITTLTTPLEITNKRKMTLAGSYDGNGHLLSFGGNGGFFHEISATGVVKNLTLDATTHLYAAEANLYPIGVVADSNYGLIDGVNTSALAENAALQGALEVFTTVDTTTQTTGAGGIVGINQTTGRILNVNVSGSGVVKAGRGIGGVAAYNHGLIEHATVSATLPAGNQANTAKSSNTYSYGGGIAGFNFGTIQYVAVSGRVFAQSAYAEAGNGNEGKNVAFGGIAGYNSGLIQDASFARNLSMKEFIDKTRATELGDVANNLGVASIHGDLYIGGIAGINAGRIEHTYVGGALIGGRDFVGGITGLTLTGGNIKNTYAFAEIAIKDDGGKKITAANAKTTLTTYAIAPSGFEVATTFSRPLLNSSTSATWVPGDLAAPKLPLFTALDLATVGTHFNSAGVLTWQSGAVTGISFALEQATLAFGATMQIDYTIMPASAPDKFVSWTSSNEAIVKVIGDGLVEGIGAGVATITGTTRDGNFTDTIEITVEDYIHVSSVTVSSPEFTLPQPNTSTDRPTIEIGTTISFVVEILPLDAQYKGFTLTTTNSRAVVDGTQVTFVYGATGPGNVSVKINFEDSTVAMLEYRFLTVEAPITSSSETSQVTSEVTSQPSSEPSSEVSSEPVTVLISSVTISALEITLPAANNLNDRLNIALDTVINLTVEILPSNATNQDYVVTTSNSRAVANGNQITFVYGATGPGKVSVVVTFADTSVGLNGVFEYRFTTVAS